ncbi:MAG: aspartate--tRNA ligase [bacterium]|nr:aspartate--tRNA ligase [bacterium]
MRTNYCGLLSSHDLGKSVTLCGWVDRIRDLGGLVFIDLRDREGIIQINVPQGELTEIAKQLGREYVIQVQGEVVKKPVPNPKLNTGDIEVLASSIEIFSPANLPPYELSEPNVSEELRLKYRYYDLRRPELQNNLRIRAKAMRSVRSFYDAHGFIEVETPVLMRSTPEGARDYIVPSRIHQGCFYALPQSPQQYKQLLMVAGFDRYYQIVKCFRDEDLRADRQPEFTQIDVEMSFVKENDVMTIAEEMVVVLFQEVLQVQLPTPFPKLDFETAMKIYGSDKPDLRFQLPLITVTKYFQNSGFHGFDQEVEKGGEVVALKLHGQSNVSRKSLDVWQEKAKKYGLAGLVTIKKQESNLSSSISKFVSPTTIQNVANALEMENGDLVICAAADPETIYPAFGNLRVYFANEFNLIKKNQWAPVWVVGFPLFEWNKEENRWTAVHHPFTSPIPEHESILELTPERVKARAYDLVLNGNEIGGGSIRNHRSDLQKKVFSVLGLSQEEAKEKFGYFLEALTYGTPPHGGIAFGFDRIVALLCGVDNIREVIAFPKTTTAASLMDGSPAPVSPKQLQELGIQIVQSK